MQKCGEVSLSLSTLSIVEPIYTAALSQPPSSNFVSGSFGAVSQSFRILSTVEPSSTTTTTALTQPPGTPVSSRLSYPELSDALRKVVSDEMPPDLPLSSSTDVSSQELTQLSTANSNPFLSPNRCTVPSSMLSSNSRRGSCAVTRDNNVTPEVEYFLDLLSQIPFPLTTDTPSQEVPQPTSVKERERMNTIKQHHTSSAAIDSFSTLTVVEPIYTTTKTTALSQPPSNPVSLVSSSHSSDSELSDSLHTLLSDVNKCSREGIMLSEPHSCDLPSFLFPIPPTPPPKTSDLPLPLQCGTASEHQLVHPPMSLIQSHHFSVPTTTSSSPLPSSTVGLPSSLCCDRKAHEENELEYCLDLFSLAPCVNLLSQELEISQPKEVENLSVPKSTSSSSPLPSSTFGLPSSICCDQRALNSEDSNELEYCLDLFSLTPCINLLSQEISQPTRMEQGISQPTRMERKISQPEQGISQYENHSVPRSTSSSSPLPSSTLGLPSSICCDQGALNCEDSGREKMTPELEYFLDIFSLAPSIDFLSQRISQPLPTGMEHLYVPTSTPSSSPLPSSTSSPMCCDHGALNSENSNRENDLEYCLDLFSLAPSINFLSQGIPNTEHVIPQPTGIQQEQKLPQRTGVEQEHKIAQPTGMEQEEEISQHTGMEQEHEISQHIGMEQEQEISQSTGMEHHSVPMSTTSFSPCSSTFGLPFSTCCDQGALDSNREKMAPELEYVLDLFSLAPSIDLISQDISQLTGAEQMISKPTGMEQEAVARKQGALVELGAPQCTSVEQNILGPSPFSHHLPVGDQLSRDRSSPSPPHCCTAADSVKSHSASLETPSQAEVDASAKPWSKKRRAVQKQRQRKLNNVCAFNYRSRKKDKESCLEARRKQLEITNAQLKKQVSVLTAEIHRLRRNTQPKTCSFFLHSGHSKIKD